MQFLLLLCTFYLSSRYIMPVISLSVAPQFPDGIHEHVGVKCKYIQEHVIAQALDQGGGGVRWDFG